MPSATKSSAELKADAQNRAGGGLGGRSPGGDLTRAGAAAREAAKKGELNKQGGTGNSGTGNSRSSANALIGALADALDAIMNAAGPRTQAPGSTGAGNPPYSRTKLNSNRKNPKSNRLARSPEEDDQDEPPRYSSQGPGGVKGPKLNVLF
jgi:hypothetical protein